ncbi:hypothetical protein HPP92_005237 [Vanilla planifolia]|uniref:DDE Tnp4 domain-containing protein n=1 Tax=Vanilla planifolia TaxID=51239 RepID=A0A835RIB6_VANPL|nr:hypothetical protein HPP92_005237 [Vanilla planifolia]
MLPKLAFLHELPSNTTVVAPSTTTLYFLSLSPESLPPTRCLPPSAPAQGPITRTIPPSSDQTTTAPPSRRLWVKATIDSARPWPEDDAPQPCPCARVAVCIWRLATGEPLAPSVETFGLGISTCHSSSSRSAPPSKPCSCPKYVRWPDDEPVSTPPAGNSSLSRDSQRGGSHVHPTHPHHGPLNQTFATYQPGATGGIKTSYSITVQGVVNPNAVFNDVSIGWPGSLSDEQVLEQSALYKPHNALKDDWIVGGGIPVAGLGDGAYVLRT